MSPRSSKKSDLSDKLTFEGILERFPGSGGKYYIAFPHDVTKLFGTKRSVRVTGTLNGVPIDRALIPTGDGTHHILINPEMRRAAKLDLGDLAILRLQKTENPDAIQLPEELDAAFDLDDKARQDYDRLNAGVQRQIVYWIDSAKRPETRIARAAEVLRRFQTGFHFGGKKVDS